MPTVLIVDDDVVSRLVLQHMLFALGCDVVEADSVDTGLDAIHHGIDLVICDYQMPDRNGLDFLEAVDATIPFVLLTGVLDRAELADARVERVDAYLTKPVSSEDLAAVVRSTSASSTTQRQ